MLRQMDLGQDRRDAFLALRERNKSESLKSFVAAQLQAEELGVPLAEALNDIATDMRRMAHQNARRQAQRASPRVSLLVTTLIVPGAMILILLSVYFASGIREATSLADEPPGSRDAAPTAPAAGSAVGLPPDPQRPRAASCWSRCFSLGRGGAPRADRGGDRGRRASRRWCRCCAGTRSARAIVRHPSYLAGELVLAALILILTGVDSPFFFFTLGTALLGGLVYGYPGAALFSRDADRRLRLRDPRCARRSTRRSRTSARVVVLPALYPLVARGRRRRAAAAGPPGGGGGGAGRPGAHAGRAGRARAAGARHARLAGQDRARHRLRRAGALAPDPGRPAGRGGGRAQAGRGRPHGGPGGARAAQRAARARRLRAAAADRDPLRGGALGRAHRHARRRRRWTTSGRCPRWRCASCAGSCKEALANVERYAHATARGRPPAPARRPRRADRSPTTATASRRPTTSDALDRRSAPSAWPGCASARGWPAAT